MGVRCIHARYIRRGWGWGACPIGRNDEMSAVADISSFRGGGRPSWRNDEMSAVADISSFRGGGRPSGRKDEMSDTAVISSFRRGGRPGGRNDHDHEHASFPLLTHPSHLAHSLQTIHTNSTLLNRKYQSTYDIQIHSKFYS